MLALSAALPAGDHTQAVTRKNYWKLLGRSPVKVCSQHAFFMIVILLLIVKNKKYPAVFEKRGIWRETGKSVVLRHYVIINVWA